MAQQDCILSPNSCSSGSVCYNFGVEPSCVRKDTIIPLDSYEFIAYQTINTLNKTISIDISKYKYYRYQSLTLEPMLKNIYIILTYTNSGTSNIDYSLINKTDIPITTDAARRASYFNPSTSKYLPNLPNEYIKKIPSSIKSHDQLVSFTLGQDSLQSAIPSKIIINNINTTLDTEFANIGIKSIQFEDIYGVKSKVIYIKNLSDIIINNTAEIESIKQESNKALSSINKAGIMLNNLKHSLTYILTI
jgi:hypothetical protein